MGAGHIEVSHHGDFNATASTALDFFLVALEHIESATAHGTNAQQAYFDRFHRLLFYGSRWYVQRLIQKTQATK